ncbi:MAG: transcription repressor NadR [Clostridium sp.]|uniref:transcription repressor NadR n=1 Tax=Clostridium sp. TaxID=1506 RepID=UPI003F3643A5
MKSKERRIDIVKRIYESEKPLKGVDLAEHYGVTRQVIVKDIAIIRASGEEIIATPDGYTFRSEKNIFKDIIVVKHKNEDMRKELEIVVKYGGIVEDVIVTHSLYGEIKGMIMVKNLNEIDKFLDKYDREKTLPLSTLTNGIHMHTISAEDKESIELIKLELKKKGMLI